MFANTSTLRSGSPDLNFEVFANTEEQGGSRQTYFVAIFGLFVAYFGHVAGADLQGGGHGGNFGAISGLFWAYFPPVGLKLCLAYLWPISDFPWIWALYLDVQHHNPRHTISFVPLRFGHDL